MSQPGFYAVGSEGVIAVYPGSRSLEPVERISRLDLKEMPAHCLEKVEAAIRQAYAMGRRDRAREFRAAGAPEPNPNLS